jgi:hypothetical protein
MYASRQGRIQTLRQSFRDDQFAWNVFKLRVGLEGLKGIQVSISTLGR